MNSISLLIKKDMHYSLNKGRFFKYHCPDATLIVDGNLDLSGEDVNSHIHVKNLIVTPRGQLSINNSQLIVDEQLHNYGAVIFINSFVMADTLINEGANARFIWNMLRHQITVFDRNCLKKPDSKKTNLANQNSSVDDNDDNLEFNQILSQID